MSFTSYSVDNDNRFKRAVDRALATTKSLKIPFTLIANDFYKSERAIFTLGSKGQYPDLADSTKKQKSRAGRSPYPILVRSGILSDSLLSSGAAGSLLIIGDRSLVLGTQVKYGIFHQSDRPRSKIPLRKFLFIGPEAKKFATSDQVGRLGRWMNILNDFVLKKLEVMGDVKK